MEGSFNLILVAISYGVAVFASYTVLELVRRVITTTKLVKTWMGAGSIVMGIGIWTMHFVGMIAYEMNMSFSYDVPITLLSLGVGIAASWFAIYMASRKSNNLLSFISAGFFLGLGIASMHYTGMAAMNMDAVMIYNPALVALSIVIAIVAAIAALWIVYTISNSKSENLLKYKILAAMVMGLAICGMHYTGMFAVTHQQTADTVMSMGNSEQHWLAISVTGASLFILGLTHLTIFFDYKLGEQQLIGEKLQQMVDRRTAKLEEQKEDLRRSKESIEIEMEVTKLAKQESEYLSTLLDQSSNEIYVFDIKTLKFTHVNQGASNKVGYSKDELKKMTPLELIPSEHHKDFKKKIDKLINNGNRRIIFETVHKCADSTLYPVEINLQISNALDNQIFVCIVQDISERKEFETKLNKAQRLESIGQLAAGVAHEINTPAQFVGDNLRFLTENFEILSEFHNNIVTIADNLEKGSLGTEAAQEIRKFIDEADLEYLNEEIPQALTQSIDGTTHIANIVKAMKQFSHPGGKDVKPVDINSTIESVITVSSNEWKFAADMEKELVENLPMVPCLAQELNQVILNLIVNASHAISDNKDEGSSEKGCITVSTAVKDDLLEIRIKDNGGGIPKHIQDKIFDPFFTTKEVGRGTGQGLSIAHAAIVDKMNGNLTFESIEGVGTTFFIHLPLEQQIDNSEKAA